MTNQTNVPEDVNEYDDLTRFADENFDTGEVDLFQFIGDDSSPLTRLKSVILSLDWDITDEYLQELAEELAELAPDWQDDRAATIYLQGMGKIGKYLRLRGAHAHPNAIKLLLTYFYDFEKIFSTPDLGEAQITQMLQNDVRKFNVLQYQIKLAEEAANEEVRGLNGGRETGKAGNALRQFKAAILELDWEVTDDSLARFAEALKVLGDVQIKNKAALLLIHGMQVLGRYISDERAHAHPGVFNLLHAFHDGLERILDTGSGALNQQQKKNILLDRVNRLNHLKSLIAPQNDQAAATSSVPAGEGAELKKEPVSVEAIPEFENVVKPASMTQTAAREALPLQTTPFSGQQAYTGEFELVNEHEAVASIDGLPSFEGGRVQLMVGMQNERAVHGPDHDRIGLLAGQRVEEVHGNAAVAARFDGLHAVSQTLIGGDDQRHAFGDALGLAHEGVQAGDAAVRIPVTHGGYGGAQDLHRRGDMGEHTHNHDRFHGQAHGPGEAVQKGLELA